MFMPVKKAQKWYICFIITRDSLLCVWKDRGPERKVEHTDKLCEINSEELKFCPPFLTQFKVSIAGVWVIVNVIIIVIILYWKTLKVTKIVGRVKAKLIFLEQFESELPT